MQTHTDHNANAIIGPWFSGPKGPQGEDRGMRNLVTLLAFCAACSPTDRRDGADGNAMPAPLTTQVDAPSPDYRALLNQSALAGEGWSSQPATTAAPPNAKAIGDAWIERLRTRGALLGYGLAGKEPDAPVDLIDVGLTKAEFEAWARENGWSIPTHIRWSFVPPMRLPSVSETARGAVRAWPASTARTGVQHQALFHGKIELRDGCVYVGEFGKPVDRLAWFHAEIGLDKDASGYFILRDRVSGQTLARLGEEMSWGGPATAVIDDAAKRALQEACGRTEIYVVGSPEATERFLTQYPHLRQPIGAPPPPPID